MAPTTLSVPASERILKRIQSVQSQIDKAVEAGEEVPCLDGMRKAYIADLIDVLNEEQRSKPREERVSYNLASTEAWIGEHSKDSTP